MCVYVHMLKTIKKKDWAIKPYNTRQCMYVSMYVCMYLCISVRMYTCLLLYTFFYIFIWSILILVATPKKKQSVPIALHGGCMNENAHMSRGCEKPRWRISPIVKSSRHLSCSPSWLRISFNCVSMASQFSPVSTHCCKSCCFSWPWADIEHPSGYNLIYL